MIRTVVETLSRGRVFRRRLPDYFGGDAIYVTPESGVCYLTKSLRNIDVRLQDRLREFVQPGSRVWDVGANVGWVSFASAYLAGAGGEVVAIEPDTTLVSLLRRSLKLQSSGRAPVSIVPVAVSQDVGVARFEVDQRGRAWNHFEGLGRKNRRGTREVNLVPTTTLDQLLGTFAPPTFVKIDVEGAEVMVLKGGARLLREHRPVIMCEVGPQYSEPVTALLREFDYEIFDADYGPGERKPVPTAPWDTLAIPRERAAGASE
jgi:FkbM family methyltransferase